MENIVKIVSLSKSMTFVIYSHAVLDQMFSIEKFNNSLRCKASCLNQCNSINKTISWFMNQTILQTGYLNNTAEPNILCSLLSENNLNASLNSSVCIYIHF